jgi:hypothetical protein
VGTFNVKAGGRCNYQFIIRDYNSGGHFYPERLISEAKSFCDLGEL